jgi:hypothetical protein
MLCFKSAEAQQPAKVPRIGLLFHGSAATVAPRTNALLQGLNELGYREGKTLTVEWRWAEEKVERFPQLAAELVRLNVDTIVAYRIMCHAHPLRWVAVKLPKLHLEVEDDWPRKQVRHVERCAEAVLLRPAPKHLV